MDNVITMQDVEVSDLLDASYATQTSGIDTGVPLFFEGPPGIGKTAWMQAYTKKNGHLLLIKIMSRMPGVDLGGVWMPDPKTGELIHCITKKVLGYIEKEIAEERPVMIFWDEVTNAGDEEQTALQSVLQDGMIEGIMRKRNTYNILAGNSEGDGCGSKALLRSLLDRMCNVKISHDDVRGPLYRSWVKWAEDEGQIHDLVLAYNEFREGADIFQFDADSEDRSQPSMRSWTKLSRIMDTGVEGRALDVLGTGCIGTGMYHSFKGFCRLSDQLPALEEILMNPDGAVIPEQADGHYAVICNMAQGMKNREVLDQEMAESIITYLYRLPETFRVFGFKLAGRAHKDFSQVTPKFAEFCVAHSDLRV